MDTYSNYRTCVAHEFHRCMKYNLTFNLSYNGEHVCLPYIKA